MPADRGGSWGNPRTTTPEWRALRLTILARDHNRCYKCGRPAIEVDHIDGNHHNDHPTNLAAICTPCHRRKSSAEGHAARKAKAEAGKRPVEQHPGIVTSTAVSHLLGCTEPCSCGAWDRATQPPPA